MRPVSGGTPAQACLAFLVALGFVLRVYNLGVPSQWMDEILVPLNASHPMEYILELSRRIEVHSPFFYMIVKALLAADSGDFLLRLPSALAGAATIWVVFQLGRELHGDRLGLYAAALIALNTHHLYLSRYIRPYGLTVFLFSLTLLLMLRAEKSGRRGLLAWLLVADAFMVLLHNLGVLVLAAQAFYLIVRRAAGRSPLSWLAVAGFSACTAALGAGAWFFFMRSSIVGEFLAQPMPLGDSLAVVGENFLRNLFSFEAPWVWGGFALWFLAGLMLLWRADAWSGFIVALFVFLPPLALVGAGMTWNLWPRHLSHVIPLASLAMAALPASLRLTGSRHALLAASLGMAGGVVFLWPAHDRFYEVDSYRDRVIGTNYKLLAREVPSGMGPADALVVTNDYFRNGLNWYADRGPQPNRFRSQTITPQDRAIRLHVLANLHYGYFAKGWQDFEERHRPESVRRLEENVRLFTLPVERDPVFTVRERSRPVAVPMDLAGFYRSVGALRDAVFFQDARGPFAMATRNNSEAMLEYVFANETGGAPGTIVLNLFYRNTGKGNHLTVETAFDGEAPAPHPISMGPDPRSHAGIVLERAAPFSRLTVRVKMVCAPLTPRFPGGNYETLRFEGLEASFCGSPDAPATPGCLEAMAERRRDNALRNFLAERFLAASTVKQKIDSVSPLLRNVPDEQMPGWSRLESTSPDTAASLVAELQPGRELLAVYPRVGGGSAVALYQLGPDGKREELLALRGRENAWTPVSGQYPIRLDPSLRVGGAYRVEAVLVGRWAQLWNNNGTIFFEQ